MPKLTLIAVLLLSFSIGYSQQNILILKKRNKVINRFWKGSILAFQLENGQWQKGEITRIQRDSFYIRPTVVRYALMGTDTLHYNVSGYSLTDIFAMPKRGMLIDYVDGRFQISRSGGHVHWYWIKSGVLFRIGAAVFAGLIIANGIINDSFSFSENKAELGIAAAVFLGGVLLHKTYTPTLRIGRKYRMGILNLSTPKN